MYKGQIFLKLTVDIEECTNSLLDKIVGWLSNIKDAITNLPQLIADGVKGLFIPNEETIETAKRENITIITCKKSTYEAATILYGKM